MSAVYKRLEREDTFISPYTAHKTFSFTSASFDEVGIQVLRAVSGTFPYTEEALRYDMVRNHFSSSDVSFINTFDLDVPFSDEANVISIPRNLYGTNIKKGSFNFILSESASLYDQDGFVLESGSDTKVGYINYSTGIIALTGSAYEERDTFYSSSFVSSSFEHLQVVYTAITASLTLDPLVDVNPFQPGLGNPTENLMLLSASHDFGTEYIYGTPDSFAVFPTAPYLAPRITLSLSGMTSSYFAVLIDDTVSGQLELDFQQNLYHPLAGVVDLSSNTDYTKFDSIEIEWKKDARDGDIVTYGFLASGSWSSSLYDYPNSSSYFEIIDQYTAAIEPVTLTATNTYPADIAAVRRYESEFTSASVDFSYFLRNYTASFQASEELLTYNYHCYVGPNEFNYTYNPSVLSGSLSGSLEDFVTGSEFRPYVTSVGIYNSANELLAVGKLGQSTPILPDTPYTFVVKIDL